LRTAPSCSCKIPCASPNAERSLSQPALALLRPREDFYAAAHPGPSDVLLLVEVADTTLAYDRDVKVPLYARAGIPVVWVVDLEEKVVWVYREAGGGGYGWGRRFKPGERLDLAVFPNFGVAAEEVLG